MTSPASSPREEPKIPNTSQPSPGRWSRHSAIWSMLKGVCVVILIRRQGVEDIKGGTPLVRQPKLPRRKLSKAELREQAAAAFLAWRHPNTSDAFAPRLLPAATSPAAAAATTTATAAATTTTTTYKTASAMPEVEAASAAATSATSAAPAAPSNLLKPGQRC